MSDNMIWFNAILLATAVVGHFLNEKFFRMNVAAGEGMNAYFKALVKYREGLEEHHQRLDRYAEDLNAKVSIPSPYAPPFPDNFHLEMTRDGLRVRNESFPRGGDRKDNP